MIQFIKNKIKDSLLWSQYKASLQESKMNDELKYYKKEYERKFKTSLIDYERNIKNIQQRIGHKVISQEAHFIYVVSKTSKWEPINILPEISKFASIEIIYFQDYGKEEFLKRIEDSKVDNKTNIFLSCLSETSGLDKGFFAFLDSLNIISMIFSLDDQHNFYTIKNIVKYIDINLTSCLGSFNKYLVENGRCLYLPEGANIDFFKPLNLEIKYDVVFIGAVYGYRKQLIKYLKNRGIKVETFGFNSDHGPISFEQMVEIWNQSKLVIGHGGMGHSNKARHLKGRDFEVSMCSVPYITTYFDELADIFKEDEEMFFYDTLEELEQKISYLLNNEGKLAKVRQNLLQKRESISWEKRFRDILKQIGLNY